ncbi:hypothetical protein OSCI_3700022 [Kamptonema sp. PCC 6506]|nr:hypothetical protein OSCI_3700022 [Kamptonema sp. PCC 6506]
MVREKGLSYSTDPRNRVFYQISEHQQTIFLKNPVSDSSQLTVNN